MYHNTLINKYLMFVTFLSFIKCVFIYSVFTLIHWLFGFFALYVLNNFFSLGVNFDDS